MKHNNKKRMKLEKSKKVIEALTQLDTGKPTATFEITQARNNWLCNQLFHHFCCLIANTAISTRKNYRLTGLFLVWVILNVALGYPVLSWVRAWKHFLDCYNFFGFSFFRLLTFLRFLFALCALAMTPTNTIKWMQWA